MLRFNVFKRKVLAGEDAGREKWYGQLKTNTRVPFDKICEMVAHQCTCSVADVTGALKEALKKMTDLLADGYCVPLGRMGNFRLGAGSKGTETEEEFTLHMMGKARVIFSPGKIIRNMIRDVKYSRDKPKVVIRTETEECRQPHME